MNKELTPLEAFYKIANTHQYAFQEVYKKETKIIENALKALEIIKKKGKIEIRDSGNGYYALLHTIALADSLIQEEFDLLKEVIKEYA